MELKKTVQFDLLALKALARSEAVPVVFAGALIAFQSDGLRRAGSVGGKKDSGAPVDQRALSELRSGEEAGDTGSLGNWVKRYGKLKSNFLFLYPSSDAPYPDGAFLLEDVEVESYSIDDAFKRKVITFLPDTIVKEMKNATVLCITNLTRRVLGKPLEKLLLYFSTPKNAESWRKKIEDSRVSILQRILKEDEAELKKQKLAVEKSNRSKEIRISDLEAELIDAQTKNSQLRLEVERLNESNKRLQNSGEVTEKAAAEYVDQKLCEVATLQKHLAQALADKEDALGECSTLRQRLNEAQRTNHRLSVEHAKSREELRTLLVDYEEADGQPYRVAAQMKKFRDRNQSVTVENKRLRQENQRLTEHFHTTERRLKEKVACLTSIYEAGDVFDYLRKWLLCSEYKIKYLEGSFYMEKEEAQNVHEKLVDLQQDARLSETVARSSFIAHRSRILAEQLKCYTSRIPASDYCILAKKTLDRFSWVFGEAEVAVPDLGEAAHSDIPWWHYAHSSPRDMIPLRDSQFRQGVIEGNKRWPLVPGVDVLAPVSPMVPLNEHQKVVHDCKTLRIRLRELEGDYDRMVEKLARTKYASKEGKSR